MLNLLFRFTKIFYRSLLLISETLNSFSKIRLLLEIKNAFFIKIRFHLKPGCMNYVSMRKSSMLIMAANWQSSFLYQFRCFQKKNLGCNFQTLFAQKRGLAHPYFLYENESLRHCLSYYLRRMATFLVLEVRLFQGILFLGVRFFQVQGPGPGPVFRIRRSVCFVFVPQGRSNLRIKAVK